MKKLLSLVLSLSLALTGACAVAYAQGEASPGTEALSQAASVFYEGTEYRIRAVGIGFDESGKRTVTIDGFGSTLHIRDSQLIAHIQLDMLAQGTTYEWTNLSLDGGLATFVFDTELYPEALYAYTYDDPQRVEMPLLFSGNPQEASVPELVQKPVEEPAEEPTLAPTKEPTPAPSEASGTQWTEAVEELLAGLAYSESDPWRLAIYQAGARDVAWEGETLSFCLRSFNPDLKELKQVQKDPEAYLAGLLENAAAYDLTVTLKPVEEALGDKEKKAVEKAVKQAASKSKSAFGQKAVAAAIGGLLFPAPAATVKKAEDMLIPSEGFNARLDSLRAFFSDDLSSVDCAPLFYAQAKQTISTEGGPHGLILRCSGANPEKLLEDAAAAAYERFSKQAHANDSDSETIREAFQLALAEQAMAQRRKPAEKFDIALNIDLLIQGESIPDHTAYLARYAFGDALSNLADEVYGLPDYPALDFPKTGRLSGSTRGTKVVIKVPKDGAGRYVQLRLTDTDQMVVDAFLRSGGSCSLKAPQGDYYVLLAIGDTWYGMEGLFGEDGAYSRTEDFEVPSNRYYLTLTLGGAVDGNMSSYGSDPSEFTN